MLAICCNYNFWLWFKQKQNKKTKTNIWFLFKCGQVFVSCVVFIFLLLYSSPSFVFQFLCCPFFFGLFLLRRIHWKTNAIKNVCADGANKLKNASIATIFFSSQFVALNLNKPQFIYCWVRWKRRIIMLSWHKRWNWIRNESNTQHRQTLSLSLYVSFFVCVCLHHSLF